MRSERKLIALIVACLFLLLEGNVFAATDGIYVLSETTYSWDGTDASLLNNPTPDYDYSYGDENSVTYILPWPFVFYGQSYSQITIDTNGTIWFGANGGVNSFNLATTGPVIQAAYNVAAHGDVIKLWATTYTESLICNRPLEVTFQGGYDSGFTNITGEMVLKGSLSILDGVVIADGLRIR